jgi:hypothetical protein
MNNIIDETVMTGDSVLGGSGGSGGLDISSGKLSISANAINSSRLATNSVTNNAIADGSVTPAKLSPFGPAWSSGLGYFYIQQNTLELATGITSNTASYIDFHSVHPLTDYETRIVRDTGVDGWFAISNQGAGRISFSSAGGFQFASAPMPNPSGTAPIFGVRAWVNFDSSRDASGTTNASNTNRFIRSSGNVTSVLKTATGKFTVTFTFAMPNTNYIVTSNAGLSGSPRFACVDRTTATTTSIEIETDDLSGNAANFTENNVMVIA